MHHPHAWLVHSEYCWISGEFSPLSIHVLCLSTDSNNNKYSFYPRTTSEIELPTCDFDQSCYIVLNLYPWSVPARLST